MRFSQELCIVFVRGIEEIFSFLLYHDNYSNGILKV